MNALRIICLVISAIFVNGGGDTMHTFMNTSWKLLLQEFGIPVFNTPMAKVFSTIQTYLRSQPLETIASL